jgi:hypothetical protein
MVAGFCRDIAHTGVVLVKDYSDYSPEAAIWEALKKHVHTIATVLAGGIKQFPKNILNDIYQTYSINNQRGKDDVFPLFF